jgi:hypothetical protein
VAGRTQLHGVSLTRVQLGEKMFAAYDGALMYGGVGAYEGLDGILGGLSQVMRRVGFDFERGRLQWE